MSVMLQVGVEGMDAVPAKFKAAYDAAKPFADLLDSMSVHSKAAFNVVVNSAGKAAASTSALTDQQKLLDKAYNQSLTTVQRLEVREKELLSINKELLESEKGRIAQIQLATKLEVARDRERRNAGRFLADYFDQQKKSLGAIEDAIEALHLPFSGVITSAKKLADSLGETAESGGVAKAAMLGVGIGIGAAVAAIGLFAASSVVAIQHTREWNEELTKIGMGLDTYIVERADAAVAAMDAMELSSKRLGATMASTLAPATTAASESITAFNLAATDGFDALAKGEYGAAAGAFALWLNTSRYKTEAKELTEVQADLNKRLREGNTAAAMIKLHPGPHSKSDPVQQLKDYKAALEANERAEAKAAETRSRVNAKSNAERDRLFQRFLDGNQAEQDAIDKATAASVKLREEQEKKAAVDAVKEVTDAYEDEAKTIAAIHALEQKEAADAAKAMEEKAKQAQDSWVASFDTIADSAEQLSEMMIKSSRRSGDAAEKAAVVAFVIQKAAGLASVAIRTSEAIMAAMTLPPPASYVAAAAAAIAGATQAAAILSQEAPSRSGGTAKQPSAPNAPNLKMGTTGEDPSGYTATQQKTSSQVETNTTSGGRYGTIDNTDGYTPPSSSVTMTRRAPGDATLNYQQGGANDPAMIGRSILDMLGEIRDAIIDQTIAIKQGGIGRGGRSVIYAAAPASSYTR